MIFCNRYISKTVIASKMKLCDRYISKTVIARSFHFGQLVEDNE